MGDAREKATKAEVLAQIILHPDPVVTVPEIAPDLPISPEAINNRLPRMREEGLVTGKKAGSAAKVWWVTTEGREYLHARRDDIRLDFSD